MSRLLLQLRFRAEDRLQQRRAPHALALVAGHVDGLLQRDRVLQHEPSDVRGRQGGQGIAAQILPIADPYRLGKQQLLRSKRLFCQLDAVERGIVWAKFIVERYLLLKFQAAVFFLISKSVYHPLLEPSLTYYSIIHS